ncbi:MAG: hypothetical protein L6R39_001459 [Caloplaca ligustica]|nr:MAG: hypothetical protein L6R39_001459 [Caloplaca ligustica]
MSEIHEQPPASALEDPQWPLNSTVGEANHELQASPSLQSKQAESHSPPPTASPPVPLREPLATSSANAGQSPSSASPHSLTRENTGPAIGPIADKPLTNPQGPDAGGLSLFITLLLTSGARHPFKIDERYFKKRNVSVDGSNPVNMSVYTLKELIWREWRDEWEIRPSSPSSIRLIYFGKLLEDKSRLHDCRFEAGSTPHVVHMTVKPQDIVDEEDAKIAKTGSRDRDGEERNPGCRCMIL